MVAHDGNLFVLGGRRIQPVDVYDPIANQWTQKSSTPIEVHHFQAVSVGGSIFMVGAMNGRFPTEKPLEKVVVYHPAADQFEFIHHIPPSRRRGASGAATWKGKIYLVGGITNGHTSGTVAWLDVYDPENGVWEKRSDAPHARDHCTAAVVGNYLFAIGGRITTIDDVFSNTVPIVDVYDLVNQQWLPDTMPPLPTPRAGLMATVFDGKIFVAGGESGTRPTAHDEVEVLDPIKRQWQRVSPLRNGRHGTGLGEIDGRLYVAVGSGRRGAKPELDSLESLIVRRVESPQPGNSEPLGGKRALDQAPSDPIAPEF